MSLLLKSLDHMAWLAEIPRGVIATNRQIALLLLYTSQFKPNHDFNNSSIIVSRHFPLVAGLHESIPGSSAADPGIESTQ